MSARSIGGCVELLENIRLAGIVLAGNAGDDPVAGFHSETAFGSDDIAGLVSRGFRDDGGMITVLEPLHGFHDDLLFQVSSHFLHGALSVECPQWGADISLG